MFKQIRDYPNYRINVLGEIQTCVERGSNRPTDTWRTLKQIYDKSCGYMIVTLCKEGVKKNKRVHRLLCEAFLPNPDNKAQINHIDGNKLNNSLNNLEWNTPKENAQHAVRTGLCDNRRKDQEVAVLQYDLEGNYLAEYASIHQASRDTGVAYQNIYKVCQGLRNHAGKFVWTYK